MAARAGVEITGLKEFRRELRALDSEWPKELRAIHKHIADTGARRSRGVAMGMGGVQAHFAGAIRGYANQREARIGVLGSRGANVAFWGAKRHTGWYAKAQYAKGPAQHPKWVGNTWEVAEFGQGPYAINPALAAYLPTMLDEYLDMVSGLAHRAFPG